MIRRLGPVLVAVLVAAVAAPAAAHVTVNPREATKGGYAKLAFRVPNERPDSGTVKLEVFFPVDEHPFRSVNVRPQPGWTHTIERQKLATPLENDEGEQTTEAVSKITWEGSTINPGEFQEFEVSAGPMPEDADQLVFKAIQTYASGEVVSWIEEAAAGGEEPERPAPVLTLIAAAEGEESQGVPAATEEQAGTEEQAAPAASASSDGGVDTLSVVALVTALLALAIGVMALTRRPATNH